MSRNAYQDKEYEADENGWYREPPSCVRQLFEAIDFDGSLIWDPACGKGNTLDVARALGFETIGSDIVQRGSRHPFFRANFLQQRRYPTRHDRKLSIVCNPPFNTPPGSAEAFMLHAIEYIPFYRAAFLVPLTFLCGQDRYDDLFSKHPPSHVAYCSQRPSMPPGTALEELGEGIRGGGKVDFAWICFSEGGPYRCESIWLRPDRVDPPTKSVRRVRR